MLEKIGARFGMLRAVRLHLPEPTDWFPAHRMRLDQAAYGVGRETLSTDNKFVISRRTVILLGVLTGVALELGIHLLSGRREAWDSSEYWTIGLPLAAVVSVAIGFLSKRSDWIWTLVIIPSQTTTMMVRGGELGGLWPLTLLLSTILSVPFVLSAFIGSRFRRAK